MPERAGHAEERSELDYYCTTPELAALCVQAVKERLGVEPESILEPGCGAGMWMEPLRATWPSAQLQGVEIHEDLADYTRARGFSVQTGDLLNAKLADYDLIIGNPPFYCLNDLLPILLDHLKPGGMLVQLLRLNYLCGQERMASMWGSRPPAHVWPLPERPGFSSDGSTDATEYAILVWTATPTKPGDTRMHHLDNRFIENRWSQGVKAVKDKKTKQILKEAVPDPRFPDPRKPRSVPAPIIAKEVKAWRW